MNNPSVKWTDIVGLDEAKEALKEAVLLPIKFPHFFEGIRKPWKGILLYGPSGTGKTLLAQACATEAKCKLFTVSSSYLIKEYKGNPLETLFQMARDVKPSIIFIKEIDLLYADDQNDANRHIITELLIQMDGMYQNNQGITVMAATTVPWAINGPLRKRFEKRIYISPPNLKERESMIKDSNKMKTTLSQDQYINLAVQTEGYSGSDICDLIRNAGHEALSKFQPAKKFTQVIMDGEAKRNSVPENEEGTLMTFVYQNLNNVEFDVSYEHFLLALQKQKKIVTQDSLDKFEKWTQEYCQ